MGQLPLSATHRQETKRMPGHVKKTSGPDPDPSPWLLVSYELKEKNKAKPYDPKKSVWVPNKADGGYLEGLQESEDGNKVTVNVKGEMKVFKEDQVCQVNPPKFDCSDDMADLTYLGDACILWNSVVRYINQLIYTYSGLFCIAINPYKRFPIYTLRTMEMYVGKRRNECPPHIFAIAEGAYQGMMNSGMNQSILITGESGAGKTENTKKVISYFATICSSGKKKEGEASLEDKIVQTNPVLEAWGNAKTVRNDNSSRFGKFIRIHFNQSGKLAGADMVIYLLEKSRLTYQQPLERCYHSFYNLMSDAVSDLKQKCLLSNNIRDYHYVSQGKVTVDSIDDKEDMQFADEAYDILGFTVEEKYNVYKNTACLMHMGEMSKSFIGIGKEEQADIKEEDQKHAKNVSSLLGIDNEWMINYFCKPKLKVGAEWVTKGQTVSQASNSVAGIARSLYERTFKFIVDKCNETLVDPSMKRVQFIGVLDIAGFEIFDYNGFEQICINFCNEKLQQFFNHHMFVLEQEEYKKEGIDWVFVDFGMDLQKCITMFEKKMGLLSILEEESMFPKATDKSFTEKLNANHLGKSPCFIKPKPPKPGQVDSHFAIVHYAGTVPYNLTGWLEKNKDPLNDTVVDQLKKGTNEVVKILFAEHPGQSGEGGGGGGKKKGAGGFKTVSSAYRDQLNNLMRTLHATSPHFIRCIVPNETKSPGVVDAALIMHQLTCNGVLEGIRICRKGFPNRMMYPDFRFRYTILNGRACAEIPEEKKCAMEVLDSVGLDREKYRLGNTKVFFRAGVLGELEEIRDDRIGLLIGWLQAWFRGYISRKAYKKLQEQRIALIVVQRNLKKYLQMRTWNWYKLWQKVKPNLDVSRVEEELQALEEKGDQAIAELEKEVVLREALEAKNGTLSHEVDELRNALEIAQGGSSEYLDKMAKLQSQKHDLEVQFAELTERLQSEEEERNKLFQNKKKNDQELSGLKKDIEDMDLQIQKAETDKSTKDTQIRILGDEVSHQDELINKINKEKKHLQECNQKTAEDDQAVEDKCNHLNKVKAKFEQTLDEVEDSLEREKKLRGDVEKAKRKVEGDLKLTQEAVADLERSKKEIEGTVARKDKEVASLAAKIEDEQVAFSKSQKQLKELDARAAELEEEIEHERNARSKAEKTKSKLSKELEDLSDRLDEAGGATSAHLSLTRNVKPSSENFAGTAN